jgi:anthranilate synthase component 1
MYFLKFKNRQIVGSSPEMLVRVEGDIVETYPIAGTRPRGVTPKNDEKLSLELLSDEKERAEHLMLVDLARNDLSKVCIGGTVNVPEFMVVEKYSHVQHIVSRVTGKLKVEASLADVVKAVFPAGTVSGAPKPRAMEIIEELEPVRRGPYAGAVGYFSSTRNCDFAITIRTAFTLNNNLCLQAGAGIVYDSIPNREWFETEHKLTALFRALEEAANNE